MEKKLTILLVDDDPSCAALVERYLEEIPEWDVDFIYRETITEAFGELTRRQIDAVLLDYHLGTETGLTFLKAMTESGHAHPVIFVTGRGDERVAVEALQAGALDYMSKSSLSPSSLRRAIANAMEKAQLKKLINTHRQSLENTNNDLARRNREIESFYHTLSHELKTPLTSVREFTALVLDGVAGSINDTQREYLEIVLESTAQMVRSIDDLLDVTRLETGKLSISMKPSNIDTVARRVNRAMEPTACERGIKLNLTIAPELPQVEMDKSRITQVLRNLLDNALKFTPRGGTVSIRVCEEPTDPATVCVSVCDTGRGIPQGHLDRIFDRLYQVRDAELSTQAGMGLGLNICKELVELHGGTLRVESEFGAGSMFSFTLKKHLPASETVVADAEALAQVS